MNMDETNWLACTRFISDMESPGRIYPLANMKTIKDLVPDQTHIFAQYAAIEPWLQSGTPVRERDRLQSVEERGQIDGYYECSCSARKTPFWLAPSPLMSCRSRGRWCCTPTICESNYFRTMKPIDWRKTRANRRSDSNFTRFLCNTRSGF